MSIRISQVGKQIDEDLRAIVTVLDMAKDPENEGKVLYIRHGENTLENGIALFDITELT